jgi:choline dehydrogenase
VGVEVLTASGDRIIRRARQQVVAAAGTLETPMLLERSGIGVPDRLRSIGVDTRVTSPLVGEGLREQRNATVKVRLRHGLGLDGRLASRSAPPCHPSGGTAAVAMALGHLDGTWIRHAA